MLAPETMSWSASSTTPAEIEAALRRLLVACNAETGACVPARVLNLVCVVDASMSGAISDRLLKAGRYHASRTILCAVERDRTAIGAVATLGTALHRSRGDFALLRETVTLELGERHLPHLDTIVDPLVVSDLPTVVWCAHGYDDAVRVLLPLAQVALLDSSDRADAATALAEVCELLRRAYVVDLAWLRSTPWRERVAAAFDLPLRRAELGAIRAVTIHHHADSAVAGLLVLGWLASRLGWRLAPLDRADAGLAGVARHANGEIRLALVPEPRQPVRGLAGVALETRSGRRLALDRGAGGLRARERDPAGRERHWTLVGASRGEPGILGEGIRQALLRDATFGPAAEAASRLAGRR
jgi:glucose-6-phosphate dehydrogenase assembly protein OpcA